ncbi:iron-sulfur cluster assembly scaffold protein [Rhizobium gallicum]|uniref:iron-sulfur cluster assembly scaffold protein n=1 Tax=Rhizobium gallicum TaxID=56730 RepID=UPI001EF91DA2|nr:iron-sulfur cluster assembly scaffold protein [Rhizobium gallicum]ULJ74339.1 iron-sulfur cluster assembly scaffold protein [Rhizobium gallicum]
MRNCSENVKEHFFNQKNTGVLETASTETEVGAIACGSALELKNRVDPVAEAIISAKFQMRRCLYAIVRSSEPTELIIGKIVNEALRITHQYLARFFDSLPPETMHCSAMGYAATATLRGRECVEDRKAGAFFCKGLGVHEGVIKGMPLSTSSPRLSGSLTTRSLAARSHASKPSKQWLSGSTQRWSTKATLRKRRPSLLAQKRSARSRARRGRSR